MRKKSFCGKLFAHAPQGREEEEAAGGRQAERGRARREVYLRPKGLRCAPARVASPAAAVTRRAEVCVAPRYGGGEGLTRALAGAKRARALRRSRNPSPGPRTR